MSGVLCCLILVKSNWAEQGKLRVSNLDLTNIELKDHSTLCKLAQLKGRDITKCFVLTQWNAFVVFKGHHTEMEYFITAPDFHFSFFFLEQAAKIICLGELLAWLPLWTNSVRVSVLVSKNLTSDKSVCIGISRNIGQNFGLVKQQCQWPYQLVREQSWLMMDPGQQIIRGAVDFVWFSNSALHRAADVGDHSIPTNALLVLLHTHWMIYLNFLPPWF